MNTPRPHQYRIVCACLIAGVALVLSLTGCATQRDSDLPWDQPQSWESYNIPGLSNN